MNTFPDPASRASLKRVDGPLKVMGGARYAGEFEAADLVHGVVVSSTIASGRIVSIDASAALACDGVLHVMTHQNREALPAFDPAYRDGDTPAGAPFRPLYDDEIHYSGQPVAVVFATTFEMARYAASLLRIEYAAKAHRTDLEGVLDTARAPQLGKGGFDPPPEPRGDADGALVAASVKIEQRYTTPVEHHNPMEPNASTVVWQPDGSLVVYDKTQGVRNTQSYVCGVFGLKPEQVTVRSPFVGGAFGSALRPQYQLVLAVLGARALKRAVRVVLSREQMFTFGHRPATHHHIALGADQDGRLQAVIHEAVSETSRFEDYIEVVVNWSGQLYQCENVRLGYQLAELDVFTPLDMRAPGAVLGVFALETALDELAWKAGIDPLEMRLRNYAERDQNKDLPFSSKALRECYQQGAERFGWSKRALEPRSMRDGDVLIGWGMASGVWDAMQQPASAKAVLEADGTLMVCSATADIGTGTYTVMTRIAADTLGLAPEKISFVLGDSSLPMAPLEGGSWTVSSVGSAVRLACGQLRERLLRALAANHADTSDAAAQGVGGEENATGDACGTSGERLSIVDGKAGIAGRPRSFVPLETLFARAGVAAGEKRLEVQVDSKPDPVQEKYSMATHSAVFAEVRVDEALGTVEVARVVSAVAAGRIMNEMSARSQISGAVVWGIGMALQEETIFDHRLGRPLNHNLAEYHIPVNADVHGIEVIFVDEPDQIVNPLGAKGVGEIGIVGVAAAIGNAIFHATGKRLRDLPMTLDKVLEAGMAEARDGS